MHVEVYRGYWHCGIVHSWYASSALYSELSVLSSVHLPGRHTHTHTHTRRHTQAYTHKNTCNWLIVYINKAHTSNGSEKRNFVRTVRTGFNGHFMKQCVI